MFDTLVVMAVSLVIGLVVGFVLGCFNAELFDE